MGVICEQVRRMVDTLEETAVDLERIDDMDLGEEARDRLMEACLRIMSGIAHRRSSSQALEDHIAYNQRLMDELDDQDGLDEEE